MTPLVIGAAIAAVALLFVLLPLLNGEGVRPWENAQRARPLADTQRDSAVQALREIEFDRATGKLSDADYADLKSDYTAQALVAMRAADAAATGAPVGDDRIEALVRSAKARSLPCRHCDAIPPEPDATYCSSCGCYLGGDCRQCGSAIVGPGARFCTSCGWGVSAA
jgi:cytochrome c-type biogenesis protein CcmI